MEQRTPSTLRLSFTRRLRRWFSFPGISGGRLDAAEPPSDDADVVVVVVRRLSIPSRILGR